MGSNREKSNIPIAKLPFLKGKKNILHFNGSNNIFAVCKYKMYKNKAQAIINFNGFQFAHLFIFSFYLSIYIFFHLFFLLSIYLSLYVSIYLSIKCTKIKQIINFNGFQFADLFR